MVEEESAGVVAGWPDVAVLNDKLPDLGQKGGMAVGGAAAQFVSPKGLHRR